jgi:ABC-type Fe3+/spermidine/putrescine transport system ATPase subunit
LYERPATPFVRDFLGRVLTFDIAPRSAGQFEVCGEPGATLEVTGDRALVTASRMVLACRPEDVRIHSVGQPGLNRLCATVEQAAYLGEHVEYTVRTQGGRQLHVFGPRRERYDPGASVSLQVDTSEATLWRVEEPAEIS